MTLCNVACTNSGELERDYGLAKQSHDPADGADEAFAAFPIPIHRLGPWNLKNQLSQLGRQDVDCCMTFQVFLEREVLALGRCLGAELIRGRPHLLRKSSGSA